MTRSLNAVRQMERNEIPESINNDGPLPWLKAKLYGKELRLLLVEDELSDVFLAEELLEEGMADYAWKIVNRPSMNDTLKALGQESFDIALVDLSLEDTQGVETVRALHKAAPELPIVVYSGSSDPSLLKQAITSGAMYFIEKGSTSAIAARMIIQSALTSPAKN